MPNECQQNLYNATSCILYTLIMALPHFLIGIHKARGRKGTTIIVYVQRMVKNSSDPHYRKSSRVKGTLCLRYKRALLHLVTANNIQAEGVQSLDVIMSSVFFYFCLKTEQHARR